MPPVSDTSGFGGKFAAGVIDTGGKFATDVVDTVVDTSGKFAAGALIPVVHLDLQISPRIFKMFEITLMLLS